jgi:hypothetical protein
MKFNTPLESLKVEFHSEAYNIFNHTHLYLPGSGLGGTLSTPTQLKQPHDRRPDYKHLRAAHPPIRLKLIY